MFLRSCCFGLCAVIFALAGCNSQTFPKSDAFPHRDYTNVYKAWDGNWNGRFVVCSTRDQRKGTIPSILSTAYFRSLNLDTALVVDVKQSYASENPLLQRVSITDTYATADGQLKTVSSSGMNKVEDGQLWCVVNKPDEQVIHSGLLVGSDTIIWSRHLTDPLKKEYFQESISGDTYEILGWGFYGSDDTTLMPKTWFYAHYQRAVQP